MKLPEAFRDLIDQQEALEANRTKMLLLLDCAKADQVENALFVLQMILCSQMTVAKDLVMECAAITCEQVEWPEEIRA